MKFVRIIDGFDHLWAVKAQDKEADELTIRSETGPMASISLTFLWKTWKT